MTTLCHGQLIDLDDLNFEFRILKFVFIFFTMPACRKQQQMFDIQNWICPNWWAAKDLNTIIFLYTYYFIFQVNNLLAIGFFIICIFLVVLPIIDDPQLVGVALGIMASGVPIYIFFIHWKNKPVWLKHVVHTWDVAVQKVFLAIPTE